MAYRTTLPGKSGDEEEEGGSGVVCLLIIQNSNKYAIKSCLESYTIDKTDFYAIQI
jgi:hypothetical protein